MSLPPPPPKRDATPIRQQALEQVGYFPDADLVTAVNLAWQLQMPLLLTGEPGTGKTVFAQAVAQVLGQGEPLRCDVRSESTARDLLYRHDAVARFADAQGNHQARAAEARHYITLQGLGEALVAAERRVLLVDEIDKAPRDLPNDLLRELDEGRFEIPEILENQPGARLQPRMRSHDGGKPLVIITSNAERQLPDPFLRRCIFHHLRFPDAARLRQIVLDRGFDRSDDDEGEEEKEEEARRAAVTDRGVPLFVALRQRKLIKKPATSELVQWVVAMHRMYRPRTIHTRLDEVRAQLDSGQEPEWTSLPALQCLIKLSDDFETLAGRA